MYTFSFHHHCCILFSEDTSHHQYLSSSGGKRGSKHPSIFAPHPLLSIQGKKAANENHFVLFACREMERDTQVHHKILCTQNTSIYYVSLCKQSHASVEKTNEPTLLFECMDFLQQQLQPFASTSILLAIIIHYVYKTPRLIDGWMHACVYYVVLRISSVSIFSPYFFPPSLLMITFPGEVSHPSRTVFLVVLLRRKTWLHRESIHTAHNWKRRDKDLYFLILFAFQLFLKTKCSGEYTKKRARNICCRVTHQG